MFKRVLVGVFFISVWLPGAWAVAISETAPTLFRSLADPRLMIFGAGNDGARTFGEKRGVANPGLSYNQDIYPTAVVVEMWNRNYALSPFAPDAESTRPAGYWTRLNGVVAQAHGIGRSVDCRITTALLELIGKDTGRRGLVAAQLARIAGEQGAPMVSVACAEGAEDVRGAIKAVAPHVLVGLVAGDQRDLERAGRYDFVVSPEAAVPVQWQGQTLVPYLHSRVGAKPVIVHVDRPNFYRELFYLASGAAGLQHAEMPSTATKVNRTAWINLRAITAFTGKQGVGLQPAPDLLNAQLLGALRGGNNAVMLLPRRGAKFEFILSSVDAVHPEYIAGWYNPATDQSIVMPRGTTPPDGKFSRQVPSTDPWLYWHYGFPAATDQDSTMTLILPEPPEPDYPEPETGSPGVAAPGGASRQSE